LRSRTLAARAPGPVRADRAPRRRRTPAHVLLPLRPDLPREHDPPPPVAGRRLPAGGPLQRRQPERLPPVHAGREVDVLGVDAGDRTALLPLLPLLLRLPDLWPLAPRKGVQGSLFELPP